MSTAGQLLFEKSEQGSAPTGTSSQAQITVGPFPRKAAVFVTAHGMSTYRGTVRNAGIILTIRAGRHEVKDDSFEGESSDITFHAAASHVFVLERNRREVITAQVEPYGSGGAAGNRGTTVDLHVVALDCD